MIDLLIKLFLPIYFFIALRNPSKAFLLWVLLSPLSTAPIFSLGFLVPDLTFDRMAIGSIILGLLLRNELKNLITSKFDRIEKWMFIFIFVLAIELLITYRPKDASIRFLAIFDAFGIPFLVYLLAKSFLIVDGNFNEKLFNNLINILIIVGIYFAAMGIYEGITLKDLLARPEGDFTKTYGGGLRIHSGLARVNGPLFVPEAYGVVLSMIFFIGLYKQDICAIMSNANIYFKKAAYALMSIVFLSGIYFNLFRNIWLGLIIGMICRFFLMPKKRFKMIAILILCILMISVNLSLITSKNVYKSRIAQSGTFYARVGAYLYALKMFSQNPIAGIGYDKLHKRLENAYWNGDLIYFKGVRSAIYAHNTLLSLLAENGLIGLIPFLFILWSIIQRMREYYSKAKNYSDIYFAVGLISIFMAYFIPLFFDKIGYYAKVNNIFYLFVGMMMVRIKKLYAEKKVSQ